MVSKYAQRDVKKMQEEKCQVEGCQMEETGVCALHDVEVERREGMKTLVDKIPTILNRVNIIMSASGLIMLLITGSFLYTTITKDDLRDDMSLMKKSHSSDMEFMRDTVIRLTGSVSSMKTMHTQSMKKTTSLTEKTSQLNDILKDVLLSQKEHESSVSDEIDTKIDKRMDGWGNPNEN